MNPVINLNPGLYLKHFPPEPFYLTEPRPIYKPFPPKLCYPSKPRPISKPCPLNPVIMLNQGLYINHTP